MIPAQRQKRILNLIREKNIISISELSEHFAVSHMTVRRDIQKLENDGKVVSVSGGVQILEHLSFEAPYDDKTRIFHAEKEKIGQKAASLITSNVTVYLDAGTTTLEIARHLAQKSDLLVITNDFVIAHYLMLHGQCELFHIGGTINKHNRSSVGQFAAQTLSQLNIDIAFISTSSWNLRGLTTPDENKIPVKKAIIQASQETILVTDSSKYGKVATFLISPLAALDYIICDNGLLKNVQDAIHDMDVELLLV